jgi:hypothetical protein
LGDSGSGGYENVALGNGGGSLDAEMLSSVEITAV